MMAIRVCKQISSNSFKNKINYEHLQIIYKLSKLDETDMRDTAGEVGTSS